MINVRYPCPCCGFRTLRSKSPGSFELCPVCHWEDDNVQAADPDFAGGANLESLNEARRNYREFGASSPNSRDSVRPASSDEYPENSE